MQEPTKGAIYDNFGEVWTVLRVDSKTKKVLISRDVFDAFGKNVPAKRLVAYYVLQTMRRL